MPSKPAVCGVLSGGGTGWCSRIRRASGSRLTRIRSSAPLLAACLRPGLGFGFWVLGFGVWVLGFGVWGLGFGFWGYGVMVYGLWFMHILIRKQKRRQLERPRRTNLGAPIRSVPPARDPLPFVPRVHDPLVVERLPDASRRRRREHADQLPGPRVLLGRVQLFRHAARAALGVASAVGVRTSWAPDRSCLCTRCRQRFNRVMDQKWGS
ncbi:hypothetical protein T484DRAFT_2541614 [Baffinella frigidus]|nr:hypothetical protein T484DRAFT_2541614 [Cryptophyta sp. CCMP2293]